MTGLFRGMFAMGFVLTSHLNRHLGDALRAAGGRKVPTGNAANRAAALGMLTAWAMMARVKRDIAFYSRMGL